MKYFLSTILALIITTSAIGGTLPLLGVGGGTGAVYTQHVVDFDGTNTYLTRDAALTGAVAGKQFTLSLWAAIDTDGTLAILMHGAGTVGGATVRFILQRNADNTSQIIGTNAAGTTILSVLFGSSLVVATGRVHILISLDLTDTAKRKILINGVDPTPTWTTYTNDNINFACADWAIGARASAASKYNGRMADVLFWPSYIDLSVAGNVALFRDGSGNPVDPATAIGTLGTPLIAQDASTTSVWHTNNGSGGGFTEHGALTDGSW